MKILFVVWNFYPNTAYTNRTLSTVKGLEESGADVSILTMKPTRLRHEKLLNRHFRTNGNGFKGALGTLYGISLLIRKVKDYDVIFCSFSNARVLKLVKHLTQGTKKIIAHERTEMPEIFYPTTEKGKAALQKYCDLVATFDHTFVISTAIKRFFVKHGVAERKLSIHPMNVNPARFDGLHKIKPPKEYIGYCGNMQNSKDGLSDLIVAFGSTVTAKERFNLMLFGKKPSADEMTGYDQQLRRLGIADKVIFAGTVPMDEMPQVLTNASVLALCRPQSVQAEGGFPTKLGEYLSTGNPVVVTNVGDIGKYIIDGETGYIAEPGDIAEFARKLDYIAENYSEAQAVGANGHKLVLKEFNYSVQASRVLDTLQKLTHSRK
jgi:glycosyltransferase involved in cell wall biosynthesis